MNAEAGRWAYGLPVSIQTCEAEALTRQLMPVSSRGSRSPKERKSVETACIIIKLLPSRTCKQLPRISRQGCLLVTLGVLLVEGAEGAEGREGAVQQSNLRWWRRYGS
jgi:hypothetical protein